MGYFNRTKTIATKTYFTIPFLIHVSQFMYICVYMYITPDVSKVFFWRFKHGWGKTIPEFPFVLRALLPATGASFDEMKNNLYHTCPTSVIHVIRGILNFLCVLFQEGSEKAQNLFLRTLTFKKKFLFNFLLLKCLWSVFKISKGIFPKDRFEFISFSNVA